MSKNSAHPPAETTPLTPSSPRANGHGSPALVPLVRELTPAPDPWQVCLRLAHLPHLLFLDSANFHPTLGRYSFATADPFGWLRSRRGEVNWSCQGSDTSFSGDPFTVLARLLARWPLRSVPGVPPFQGGAAGLLGYDLCHHIERLPWPAHDDFGLPDLALGFFDWVVAFDGLEGRAWIISTGLPAETERDRLQRARDRMEMVLGSMEQRSDRRVGRVERNLPGPPGTSGPTQNREGRGGSRNETHPTYPVPGLSGVWSNFDRPGFLETIRRGIEYVHAGDCFQVNLAQRLLARLPLPPLELYARLRQRNAAPFAGYFDLGEAILLSASPERFLRLEAAQGGNAPEVETRPIKGTRPRGATPEEDRRQAEELLRSLKDRAENVMIIDLLRNDLGRVCQYGTVRVEAVCRLESYRYVHHLVSEVRGRLRPGLGPVDLLRACFPGGSVTGAPKVRAMQIIAELEPTVRGPYCGSLGYIGFDGALDTSILIRTFTQAAGWLQFPVGGGIVADSTPESEYAETLHKARGLLRALE
jgi:para-aminobenzoate synthetase component 1